LVCPRVLSTPEEIQKDGIGYLSSRKLLYEMQTCNSAVAPAREKKPGTSEGGLYPEEIEKRTKESIQGKNKPYSM
jgi:hypothetical protein